MSSKKYFPKFLLDFYHFGLAVAADFLYRFPSKKMGIIGVTGTNGKTTTCNLIWQVLNEAGFKTGLTTSINFKIGDKSWANRTKQGMQGRFRLRRLLGQMLKSGCQYAVIETTSEGIKQYRHWGIAYDVAVFTNLTPEHIESHGSFESYKKAKGQLFRALNNHRANRNFQGKDKKVIVANIDDSYAEYFLSFPASEKWGVTVKDSQPAGRGLRDINMIKLADYKLSGKGTEFTVAWNGRNYAFKTNLLGLFNIYNCLESIAAGLSQDIRIEIIQKALEKMQPVPGRMEIIYDSERNVRIIVDYAHDPAALENVYMTINDTAAGNKSKVIAVLGAVGGGRDKAKRPKLGALASKYARYVIVTNEDPYDDDPLEIMEQVEKGVLSDQEREIDKNYWKILDRREAIRKALELSQPGDFIALTGKGCEEVMAVAGGFIPWDDREVVREELEKLKSEKL